MRHADSNHTHSVKTVYNLRFATFIVSIIFIFHSLIIACSSDNGDDETDSEAPSPETSTGHDPTTAVTIDSGIKDTSVDINLNADGKYDASSDAEIVVIYVDASDAEVEVKQCNSDSDCDDGLFCNGIEKCIFDEEEPKANPSGTCFSKSPCIDPTKCNEDYDRCNCDYNGNNEFSAECGGMDCDDDNDGYKSMSGNCAGTDCDDQDESCYPGGSEICDDKGKDEDCNPETFDSPDPVFANDKDGDDHVSYLCYNTDKKTGERHGGDDCNDEKNNVHPKASEVCDEIDNDCNGLIDEEPDADVSFGLRRVFCLDGDHDGWCVRDEPKVSCSTPEGYIEDTGAQEDCNDDAFDINPEHEEICDGKDNDCDGKTDTEDLDVVPLVGQPTFPNTTLSCKDGEWHIDECPHDWVHCSQSILQGCETPATTLSNCRKCSTNCLFSCGDLGCDEIEEISVGSSHVCAFTTEKRPTCWGRNGDGRLGNDSSRFSAIPTSVIGITEVKKISASDTHTCAIAGIDSAVYCWGSNDSGQLGISTEYSSSLVPEIAHGYRSPTLTKAIDVSTGNKHACALRDEGPLICWGSQLNGRLGNGVVSENVKAFPVIVRSYENGQPVENAVQVVSGVAHSCVLQYDEHVKCWGSNAYGQLGDNSAEQELSRAQEVPGLDGIKQISAGFYHTCALSKVGKVYCWGDNSAFQLGHKDAEKNDEPMIVTGLNGDEIDAIVAGGFHTCALLKSNELKCWGSNSYGERGDENTDASEKPVLVEIGLVDRVAAGGGTTCAREKGSKQVNCWGYNFFGQLGNDTSDDMFHSAPENIKSLDISIP